MPLYSDLDKAYRGVLISKVATASGNQSQKEHKFDKSTFQRQVKHFYGSKREVFAGNIQIKQSFCVISGWQSHGSTSAAHLVPKSLNSGELEYLFGVSDISMLSDPRVAIPLSKSLEVALDVGQIVIVPIDAEKTGAELRWRCLVTNLDLLPLSLTGDTKWRDVHMKELHWSNSNRPAKRYLYFRFLMTYLMCKTKGQWTGWVDQIAAKGKIWCTPGPYLRRSMVQLLAKECGDQFLPEVFYKEQTFEDQALGRDEEKGMARDVRDKMVLSSSRDDSEDDSSEDSQGDSSEDSDEGEDLENE